MKKILTIALTLCLLVTALAGCGPRRSRSDRRPHGSSGGSHGRTRRRGRQTDRRL